MRVFVLWVVVWASFQAQGAWYCMGDAGGGLLLH